MKPSIYPYKTKAMKDLTKYYLNLEKCSEDEIKSLPQILENAGEKIHDEALNYLSEGMNGKTFNCLAITDFDIWTLWNENAIICLNHTELTYPEFIKLFEGGEETEVQKLKKQIDLYKECFELFIPTDKWDEANEFLSINNNPLAKHLSKVQRGVEKKPKF